MAFAPELPVEPPRASRVEETAQALLEEYRELLEEAQHIRYQLEDMGYSVN